MIGPRVLLLLLLVVSSLLCSVLGSTDDSHVTNITMPSYRPNKNDDYVCTAQSVESMFPGVAHGSKDAWITGLSAAADATKVHHMLLFLCDDLLPGRAVNTSWDCQHHGLCQNGQIIFGWAKNAAPLVLPDHVGFRVGGAVTSRYVLLQIHYAVPQESEDNSGLVLRYTHSAQTYKAGIYLLMSVGGPIPADTSVSHLDVNCELRSQAAIHPFAFRAHAHSLGVVITGYQYSSQNQTLMEIARGNPGWPQAFYPVGRATTVRTGDLLHARCTYNSTGRHRDTAIGATSNDEMCNLYLMYYTSVADGPSSFVCSGEAVPQLTANLPLDSDKPLPSNYSLERLAQSSHNTQQKDGHSEGTVAGPAPAASGASAAPDSQLDLSRTVVIDPAQFDTARAGKSSSDVSFVDNWAGSALTDLGQVTAVALTPDQRRVVLFHRADRPWHSTTFDSGHRLQQQAPPIARPTIVYLDAVSGRPLAHTGANFFFVPHGLTIDHEDNIWCTDVGMHQVFKFGAQGGTGVPLLTIGERFVPGSDERHFCKPTAVAVLSDGTLFVADGYCNARVLKMTADGRLIASLGQQSSTFAMFGAMLGVPAAADRFNIPHALAVSERLSLLCVADRENGRVSCFNSTSLAPRSAFTVGWLRSRIYSVALTHSVAEPGTQPSNWSAHLYVVNGPNFLGVKVQGFIVELSSGAVVSTFSPGGAGFSNPHDLAVTSDGSSVFVAELAPNKVWKFASLKRMVRQGRSLLSAEGSSDGAMPRMMSSGATVTAAGAARPAAGVAEASGWSSVMATVLVAAPLLLVAAILHRRYCATARRVSVFPSELGKERGWRHAGRQDRQGFSRLTSHGDSDSDSEVEQFRVLSSPSSRS